MAVIYTDHFVQFFDDEGDPLAGGKLYAYEAGTTTPKATYTTEDAGVQHAHPIVLDSSGRATIFIQGSYRFDLYDQNDVLIDSTDNVSSFSTTGGLTSVTNIDAAGAAGIVVRNSSSANVVTLGAGPDVDAAFAGDVSAQALTCTTIDTGQGANEVYAMDQDVATTDDVVFNTVDTGQLIGTDYVIADDAATSITVGAEGWAFIRVDDNDYIMVTWRTSGTVVSIAAASGMDVVANTALTGTSGTNGNATVSYNGTSLYIENRRGGSKTFNVLIIKGVA
jgi:hypothetical protein